jgi:NADPH-dependent 2,4-dienoyl-CoA reductase/sulfur reductase-like enzyme/rhodanese-related sulfurtransferase
MNAKPTRIVVVGGVAGGASAATKARRTDESAEITIFERGPYVSFANCGLPYFVGGDIPEVDDLLLMTPERFAERFRIEVRVRHEVLRIDRSNRRVEVCNVDSGETHWEPYDRLILSPGGKPVLPPVPGIDLPGVYSLTTVPAAEALRCSAREPGSCQAVVVGGGFIGLEAAEALLKIGMEVHLVEKLPQVMPQMDPEMALPIADHLVEQGARLHLGTEVTRFIGDGYLSAIELSTGEVLPVQVAVVAIGVRPELTLAREAGLEIGECGGVVVNDRMQTSDPAVYACGDAAEVLNRVTGRRVRLPLAGPANKQGRVAGANAAGGGLSFPGVVGTSIVKVCHIAAALTGLSEREARRLGFDPIVSYVHPLDHAGYYPGARDMTVKLVADRRDGRILGAQVVGAKGVDKRVDVLATAIYGGMTVEELEGLDLAYAPPFSSAKDPAIMAGFVAANDWRQEVQTASPAEAARQMDGGVRVLDVRTPEEYREGHIPGALHIPLDELRNCIHELRRDEPLIAYCKAGYRSYHACKILAHHGYDVINLSGGFTTWRWAHPNAVEAGEPAEASPASEVR